LRLEHFQTLRPICPVCRAERGQDLDLFVSIEERRQGDDILEGVLQCPAAECKREFPIVDGIPIVVPDVRGYLALHLPALTRREDLSPTLEGLLVEGSGAGSALDVAWNQLSSYAWDHYGEWDPQGNDPSEGVEPGSVVRTLEAAIDLAKSSGGSLSRGRVLDLGSAVGRSGFELARRTGQLVVGVDLSDQFLRLASRVLRHGTIRYPRRRLGVLYDWREFPVPIEPGARVDFWAADAAHLPFRAGTFGAAVGLNVLDCLYSPFDGLKSLARVLQPGSTLALSTPYDWTSAATMIEAWIGGHSPRSAAGGSSAEVLKALLTPGAHPGSIEGFELIGERDQVPWTVRIHQRSLVRYRLHLLAATRR
jgi:SAM-dependent methyltransferase/uncharacterized protein YbaR (Trm112 family)